MSDVKKEAGGDDGKEKLPLNEYPKDLSMASFFEPTKIYPGLYDEIIDLSKINILPGFAAHGLGDATSQLANFNCELNLFNEGKLKFADLFKLAKINDESKDKPEGDEPPANEYTPKPSED